MEIQWMFATLLLVFTHKGRAEPMASISIQPLSDGDGVSVLCHLLRNERVTQVNWIASSGPNTTHLATYHPVHGTFVPLALWEGVEVQNASDAGRSYRIVLTGGIVGENSSVCCTFNTFPSGVFQKCIVAQAVKLGAHVEEEEKVRRVEQWFLMVAGFLTCFLSVTFTIVHCWRHCCRRKVLAVRYVIDHSSRDTEDNMDASVQQCPLPATPSGTPQGPKTQDQPKPKPHGFDPSKLYAKIKLDLLYGRLWKAYQGAARPWTSSPPPPPPPPPLPTQETPQRVYSFLGEHGPVLFTEEPPDSQPSSPPQSAVHNPSPLLLLQPQSEGMPLTQLNLQPQPNHSLPDS